MRIDPLRDLGRLLLEVEKPARYLGGEYGSIRKEGELYTIALAFPDLYDIGMSNQAIRIIYNLLNATSELRCERVFVPAPDFEAILKRARLPLYTLESGIPVRHSDILALSVGYELCGTGIITLLESSGIPRHAKERSDADPLVIAGGPAITNPLPFAPFLDAVWIGEAEAGFVELCVDLAALKKAGKGRAEALDLVKSNQHMWTPGGKARRAIYAGFSTENRSFAGPVPTIRPVQDHGVAEIMRGCPNGCRFCHAGFYYRPMRCRDSVDIEKEVESIVRGGGYREITLSSLSTGDYPEIEQLMGDLEGAWSGTFVSFQLPSLKVNGFTLSLLKRISSVRKSSLTFAVETPEDAWQRRINKEVHKEKILEILRTAKELGWKSAKFYFMIGLPVGSGPLEEVEAIAVLMTDLVRETRMTFTVNVGTFVPKPHTPFQWAAQLRDEEAYEAFVRLKRILPRSVSFSFHSPLISELEGLISRGDERSSILFEQAWERGLRLEAWEEHRNLDAWRSIMDGLDDSYRSSVLSGYPIGHDLPWNGITIGVAPSYLEREWARSTHEELSPPCMKDCTNPCGACRKNGARVDRIIHSETDGGEDGRRDGLSIESMATNAKHRSQEYSRLLFSFRKTGPGAYYPHLSLMDVFAKAFMRCSLPIAFSQGFNPQPHIEIAHALAMGIESEGEWALVELSSEVAPEEFMAKVNGRLPEGLNILSAHVYPKLVGRKHPSLAALLRASVFIVPAQGACPELGQYPMPGRDLQNVDHEERDGLTVLTVRTAPSGRELQALYPFKKAWGDRIGSWPVLPKRISILAGIGEGPLSTYPEIFDLLYSQE